MASCIYRQFYTAPAITYLLLITCVSCWDNSVRCGGNLLEKAGSIKSPNYPSQYPPDSHCVWTIKAPEGYRIMIYSVTFMLEGNNCEFDHLEIADLSDTPDGRSKDQQFFCGQNPVYFSSVTNRVRITFKSDSNDNYYGFKLIFTRVSASQDGTPINSCNQTRINSPGFLSSPGYPRAYAGHTNCFYHLKAPSDNKIKLEFLVFDIQSNTHCRYNYLQIFDGPDMSYPHSEKHCGNQDLGFYYSTAPEILIRFVSTSSYYSGAGFHVRFSFHTSFTTDHSNQSGSDDIIEPMDECRHIIDTKGVKLESPGFPESYPSNHQCVYIIRSPPEETVTLTFHKFKLEKGENCQYDYVKIKDGESAAADVLDKLCGVQDNKTYKSSGRSLRLDFVTDVGVSFMGFSATYTFSNCPLRCYNGGTCHNNTCKCSYGYQGPQCQYHKSCKDKPCENNATCSERRIGYHCHCTTQYTGYNCERKKYEVKLTGRERVQRRDNVEFKCFLNGKAARNAKWFFNENRLQVHTNDRAQIDKHVLYIHHVTEEDEGDYLCAVYKDDNAYYDVKKLKVSARCRLRVEEARNITVSSNQTARLFCPIRTHHGVKVSWKKNGHPIRLSSRKVAAGRTLKFESVISVDEGKYTCIAVGPNGCSAKADVWLTYERKDIPQECGRNNFHMHDHGLLAKIKSGHRAALGSAPWFVNFVEAAVTKSFCGGTLISRTHIVTAAHCIKLFKGPFDNANVHVYLGTQNCSGLGGIKVQIKKVTVHPRYNQSSLFDSDIAIVELQEKLYFNKIIQPLCLVDSAVVEEVAFYSGVFGTVVGCGMTSTGYHPHHLNEVKVPYVSNESCRSTLHVGHNITSKMFCAGSIQAHQGDSCQGDSGGPYAVQLPSSSRWILVGIVSWGYKCDQSDSYGVYTNVGQFFDWITRIMSEP